MMTAWADELSDSEHEYIINLSETDQPIGECRLLVAGRVGILSVVLLPDYWNMGYGTETVIMLMQSAESIGVHKVEALTDDRNGAIIHILTKLGFRENIDSMCINAFVSETTGALCEQRLKQFGKTLRTDEA